jgi:hypothetical protein
MVFNEDAVRMREGCSLKKEGTKKGEQKYYLVELSAALNQDLIGEDGPVEGDMGDLPQGGLHNLILRLLILLILLLLVHLLLFPLHLHLLSAEAAADASIGSLSSNVKRTF